MASIAIQNTEPDVQTSIPHQNVHFQSPTVPLYPPSGSQTPTSKIVKYTNTPYNNDKGSIPQMYDIEQAQPLYEGLPQETSEKPGNSPSWGLYSRKTKIGQSYDEFDNTNPTQLHRASPEDTIPMTRVMKLYNYLLNSSIVTRWIVFILPIMGVLWIPGILGLTKFPDATIWSVKLLWWSIWFSILWGGWWAALAAALIVPGIIRVTVGMVAVGTRRYIDRLFALHRYLALVLWTLAIWISFHPLIGDQEIPKDSSSTISLIGKLSFALYLSATLLFFEKFSIQWIAGKFHERSYAERIEDQKFAAQALVVLYRGSHARLGELSPGSSEKEDPLVSRRILKKALSGVRTVASSTTTIFGDVASEIMGNSVLQPHSPRAMVKTALESANKSRLLARRFFYSFVKPGAKAMVVEDIVKCFSKREDADAVFALFDKDSNGDATLDDIEMACMDLHREQTSLEHSMQDLDSAVGRLDNILITIYVFVVILIFTVAMDAQLQTLIAAGGTLVLGLSWLIGASLQEVLASIVFLFIKHPFDVGDRISINSMVYTVREMFLLSTVFVDSYGTLVQAPNTVLNTMFIQNYRRSRQMSEKFSFDVSFSVTFDQLQTLRRKMIEFLESERRDFQPVFDVAVVDFPEQGKMTLTADIKYKSNWQQGALKAQRRNKWICALKQALGEVKIFGPNGNPDAKPDPQRYTMVPWEEIKEKERRTGKVVVTEAVSPRPVGGWRLSDQNAAIRDTSEDLFGDADEEAGISPSVSGSQAGLAQKEPDTERA